MSKEHVILNLSSRFIFKQYSNIWVTFKCAFHLLTYNRVSAGILKLVSPDVLLVLRAKKNSQDVCMTEVVSFPQIAPILKTLNELKIKIGNVTHSNKNLILSRIPCLILHWAQFEL